MNKTIIAVLLVLSTVYASAQYQTKANEKGPAYYVNPVFAGDYPDPSILRDGNDYYMVHSSFEYYPGLPANDLERAEITIWPVTGPAVPPSATVR